MDDYKHPMTSSWMMDLPMQMDLAKKLMAKERPFRTFFQKIKAPVARLTEAGAIVGKNLSGTKSEA